MYYSNSFYFYLEGDSINVISWSSTFGHLVLVGMKALVEILVSGTLMEVNVLVDWLCCWGMKD